MLLIGVGILVAAVLAWALWVLRQTPRSANGWSKEQIRTSQQQRAQAYQEWLERERRRAR